MSLTRNPQTGLITNTSVASATTTTAYNQFAEPTTQTYAFPGGAFSETYERDNAGRTAAKNVTSHGNQTRYAYTYDPAGRLTDVTKDGIPWRTYAYDANSNRTSVTRAGEPAEEAVFDAQDKMTSQGDQELSYNANGELIKKGSAEFTYSSSGQLTAAETDAHDLTYSYDALGNRTIKKVDGDTTQAFLYAPGLLGPVAQLSQGSSTETRFVYATRTNVPDLMVRGNTTYRLITDQLGSVRMVVNASTGAVAQEIEYDPFGEVISDTSPGFQPFGFAGGLYDPETGLTHFGAREYDAELGRWTSRDPIGFAGGDSNLYGYVVQDPVNLVDLTGNSPFEVVERTLPGLPDIDWSWPDIDWPKGSGRDLFWTMPEECLLARVTPPVATVGASNGSNYDPCDPCASSGSGGGETPDPEPEEPSVGPFVFPPDHPVPGVDPEAIKREIERRTRPSYRPNPRPFPRPAPRPFPIFIR